MLRNSHMTVMTLAASHVLKSWTVLDADGTQSHPLLPCSFQCPVVEKWQEIQQEVRRESLVGQELAVLHLAHPVWRRGHMPAWVCP